MTEYANSREQINYSFSTSIKEIPLTRASIKADINDLRELTIGASYTARSGQANVTAERKGDTIYITAECDSIRTQILHLEAGYLRKEEAKKEENREYRVHLLQPFKWFLSGFITGIIALLLIKLLIRIKK